MKHEAVHTRIHAAKIDCQATVRLSENNEERQSALCMMSAHEGKDIAYGEMQCVGKKDECKGEFTFSWGRGAFKGITGTTPFVGGINIEKKEEGRIYGSAAWPHMTSIHCRRDRRLLGFSRTQTRVIPHVGDPGVPLIRLCLLATL